MTRAVHQATFRPGSIPGTWDGGCTTCGVGFGGPRSTSRENADAWCAGHNAAVAWFSERIAGAREYLLDAARPLTPASDPVIDRLYQYAEDLAEADVPFEQAIATVREGYSSIAADRMIASDP